MKTLKFSLLLPCLNVPLSALVLLIGYQRYVPDGLRPAATQVQLCFWFNAPALLLQNLAEAFCRKLQWHFNFPILHPYIFLLVFLGAAALVWYVVGRAIDHRTCIHPKRRFTEIACDVLLVVIGLLLFTGLLDPSAPHLSSNTVLGVVHDLIYVCWAFGLSFFFTRDIVRRFAKAGGPPFPSNEH